MVDWFQWPINLSRVILCLEVRESHTFYFIFTFFYIYIFFFCFAVCLLFSFLLFFFVKSFWEIRNRIEIIETCYHSDLWKISCSRSFIRSKTPSVISTIYNTNRINYKNLFLTRNQTDHVRHLIWPEWKRKK